MEKSIHLRMPKILYNDSLEIKDNFGFSSIQEFIKEAVRKTVYEYKKQKALATLKNLYGSLKGKVNRLTKEDKKVLAEQLIKNPKKYNNIFEKYNL